jgi:hypothetical protein
MYTDNRKTSNELVRKERLELMGLLTYIGNVPEHCKLCFCRKAYIPRFPYNLRGWFERNFHCYESRETTLKTVNQIIGSAVKLLGTDPSSDQKALHDVLHDSLGGLERLANTYRLDEYDEHTYGCLNGIIEELRRRTQYYHSRRDDGHPLYQEQQQQQHIKDEAAWVRWLY